MTGKAYFVGFLSAERARRLLPKTRAARIITAEKFVALCMQDEHFPLEGYLKAIYAGDYTIAGKITQLMIFKPEFEELHGKGLQAERIKLADKEDTLV